MDQLPTFSELVTKVAKEVLVENCEGFNPEEYEIEVKIYKKLELKGESNE